MTVIYTASVINSRLNDVKTAIDAGGIHGFMNLLSSAGTALATVTLNYPCGTVSGGVLTFTTPASAPLVSTGGNATTATVTDSNGNLVISGLTIGLSTASDIVMSSILLSTGQIVTLTYAAITGR